MAVFLVGASLLSGAWFLKKTGAIEVRGVLGGPGGNPPALIQGAEGAGLGSAAGSGLSQTTILADSSNLLDMGEVSGAGQAGVQTPGITIEPNAAAIQDPGVPIGPSLDRGGMLSYTVQPGDTLSQVAAYFGISIDTIVSANPGLKANLLHVGQKLSILPVSGVVYTTQNGDTLQSISAAFGIPESKIRQFNGSVDFSNLDAGMSVVIPGGKSISIAAVESGLPNFNKNFIMPASGYDWGILHHYNAVDIANSCGTPVVASAEGLVVPDPDISDTAGGWNDGYGNFVLIEHPFGNDVETRYAHLEKILVQPGDYVEQGQEIGLMGETGDATGCHVHFEVIGAKNPFAK